MSVMQSLVSQVVQQRGKKDIDEKEDAANEDDTNEDKEVIANRANAGVAGVTVGKDEEEMGKDEDEEIVANGANVGVSRDGKG